MSPIKLIRKYTPENINRLKDKLSSTNWSEVLTANDVDTSYNKFMNIFVNSFNECIPLVQCKSNNKRKPRNPWVTKALLRSINRKNNLYYKYRTNPSDKTRDKYVKYKNILTTLLRHEKKEVLLF